MEKKIKKLKHINISICLLVFFITFSCRRISELSEENIKYIPYNGSELLIFSSDHNIRDTIFLKGYDTYYTTEKLGGFMGKIRIQHYNLMCYFGGEEDTISDNGKTYLIGLTARENGTTIVNYNINYPDRNYFFWNALNIDSILKLPLNTYQFKTEILHDVVIINNKELGSDKINSKPKLDLIYWSYSKGIVGFVLTNGETWKLEKIFQLHQK